MSLKNAIFIGLSLLSSLGFAQASSPFIIDQYYSPYMGGADLISAHRVLMQTEDTLLRRHKSISESLPAGLFRMAELAFFWGPVDSLAYVTQRTFFGAGFRTRELDNLSNNRIRLMDDWPLYYDHDAIQATFDPNTPLTEVIDYTIAPGEASMILANTLRMSWIADKSVDGRQSLLYALSTLDLAANLHRSHADMIQDPVDMEFMTTEAESYLYYMEQLYPESPMSLSKLKAKSLVNLADPYLWYAIYSPLYYIVRGKALEAPMLPFFFKTGYLPGLKMGLAPYGPEFYLMNYLRTSEGNPITAYFKWGSLGGRDHWGAGIEAPYLITNELSAIGLKIDYFHQYLPVNLPTLSDNDVEDEGLRREKGFAACLIATQKFKKDAPFSLTAQFGYKTKGYLPGEVLRSGVIARAGFALSF